MENMICKTEYNELFDKFMLTIKDEIYSRFNDYLNNNIEKRETGIEMIEKVIEEPIKKKGRGRPKKNPDSLDVNKEEPKKRGRGRPKKEKVEQLIVTVVNDTDDENESKKRGRPVTEEREIIRDVFEESNNNNNDEDSDDEGTDVIRIEIEGKIYLRDGTNKLYNMSDQDFVGIYDEINGTIMVN
jgi:hypothetical protein